MSSMRCSDAETLLLISRRSHARFRAWCIRVGDPVSELFDTVLSSLTDLESGLDDYLTKSGYCQGQSRIVAVDEEDVKKNESGV